VLKQLRQLVKKKMKKRRARGKRKQTTTKAMKKRNLLPRNETLKIPYRFF
jgi:hypothetical protein